MNQQVKQTLGKRLLGLKKRYDGLLEPSHGIKILKLGEGEEETHVGITRTQFRDLQERHREELDEDY